MATITKTVNNSLIAWQDVATANAVMGTELDVSTDLAMLVLVWIGRRSGTAFTAGWPNVRIEASAKSSGTDAWVPVVMFQPVVGAATLVNTTLNGAVSAGATTFVVASATGITAGDLVYLDGDTDAGNEIVQVKSVSSNTITPEEAVTNAHASGNAVTDQAERYAAYIDLTAITRIRAVIDNAGSGQTAAFQVLAVTGDSIG